MKQLILRFKFLKAAIAFSLLIAIVFAACSNDKKTVPAAGDTTSSSMAADAMKNDAKAMPVDSVSAVVNSDSPKAPAHPGTP